MDNVAVRQNRRDNWFQTVLLMLGLGCLNVVVGWLVFGSVGFWFALGLTLIGGWLAQGICPMVVLKMYHAQQIDERSAPELTHIFQQCVSNAKVTVPVALFYIPSKVPNAFAVGNRQRAAVALTDGIIRVMNPRELQGIIAHEVAHIRNDDLKVMVTADAMGRVVSLFARLGVVVMLFGLGGLLVGVLGLKWLLVGILLTIAPTISMFLQLALSRSREFNADLGAAELTHDPRGLIMALTKLERVSGGHWLQKILAPDQGKGPPAWLRTHPPTQQRILELLEVENAMVANDKEENIESPWPQSNSTPRSRIGIESQPRVRTRPKWHPGTGLWY